MLNELKNTRFVIDTQIDAAYKVCAEEECRYDDEKINRKCEYTLEIIDKNIFFLKGKINELILLRDENSKKIVEEMRK